MRQIVGVFFWETRNIGKILRIKLSQFSLCLIITDFKIDRYVNNFHEHLFGLLRLRKCQMSLQNEAVKPNLIEFKVQCSEVFVAMTTNLSFCVLI